jgi:hypothetical protein
MDNQTISIILWIAAGVILVAIIMRRRSRKSLR